MTVSTSSHRAAMNRNNPLSGSIRAEDFNAILRDSPSGVPPGSLVKITGEPLDSICCDKARACELFPAPSGPSNTINAMV